MTKRKAGEALHAERETTEQLIARRQTIDGYTWASQYQQAPIPIGGNLVKRDWLSFYDELPAYALMTAQSLDTATRTEHLNDYRSAPPGASWAKNSTSLMCCARSSNTPI